MKNKIIAEEEGSVSYDKMQIALAIRNSTYEDELSCSLLENQVLSKCDDCNLKSICEMVEEAAQKYVESTTKLVSSFSFH